MGLQINHAALEARNGFAHFPQAREERRLLPRDPELPCRIIVLDGSGAITFDVPTWLAGWNIRPIQPGGRGNAVAAIGTNSLGADPIPLQPQVRAAEGPRRSIAVAAWLPQEKLRFSRPTVERVAATSAAREAAIARIESEITHLGQPRTGSKTARPGQDGKRARAPFNA